jgi:acyl dehydratase
VTIDVAALLDATVGPSQFSWNHDDVILYHLGLGAGVPPDDPRELRYVYEIGLQVLPTFAVLPPAPAVAAVLDLPAFCVDRSQGVHGEQEIIAYQPLPPLATVHSTARVANVYDKGSGALAVVEAETANDAGEPLFRNRFSLFFRGEGGFGGDRGPTSPWATPTTRPDHVARMATLPQQALIFRLSGDKTTFHVDPAAAAGAGFPRPILQGLCTYGMAAKAVVDLVADGRSEQLSRYLARFTGVVFPGDALIAMLWGRGSEVDVSVATEAGQVVLQAKAWMKN